MTLNNGMLLAVDRLLAKGEAVTEVRRPTPEK
jgi:hypothetical protein